MLEQSFKKISRGVGFACILLLTACASDRPAPVANNTFGASGVTTQRKVHIMQSGETLMALSRMYGVSVDDLATWNSLVNPNQVNVGQRIYVSAPGGMGQVVNSSVAVATPIAMAPLEEKSVAPASSIAQSGTQSPGAKQGGVRPYSSEQNSTASTLPPAVSEPASTSPTTNTTSTWIWPASGKLIATFKNNGNKGIDIAGKMGEPVLASASGKVVYAGSNLRGYGKLIIIKHDATYLTAYAHNSKLLVKEGDMVTKGRKIAEMGNTDAKQTMLHFELRKKGTPIDPLPFLGKQ